MTEEKIPAEETPEAKEKSPRLVEEEKVEEQPKTDFFDKIRPHKFKILGGILGIFVLAGAVFGACRLRQRQILPGESCIKTKTREEMSLSVAKEIALASECVKEGNLTDEYSCNQYTGTWWINLDIEKEGCNPACVVDISTKKAEINWRCTGFIPLDGKTFCQDPRPQFCTMECIVNPPYICGSDGKSYCTECQACANPEVEWYVTQDEPCGT